METNPFVVNFNSDYIDIDDWCNRAERKLLTHQLITGNTVQMHANNLVLYHGLGSGKTCSSILVLDILKRQFKDVEFIISTTASVVNSFKDEFQTCPIYSEDEENPYALKKNDSDVMQLQIMKRIQDHAIKKGTSSKQTVDKAQMALLEKKIQNKKNTLLENQNIRIISHSALIGDNVKRELINSRKPKVIIIDEIQNMISEDSKEYEKLYGLISRLQMNGTLERLFCLTATPFKNFPNDIALLVNLLQPENQVILDRTNFINKYDPKKNSEKLYDLCRGNFSYVSSGHPNAFPFKRIVVMEHVMTQEQVNSYVKVLNEKFKKIGIKDINRMIERNISNDSGMQTAEYIRLSEISNSSRGINEPNFDVEHLEKFAPKIKFITDNIIAHHNKGTVFVFSHFLQYGIKLLEFSLLSKGYTPWKVGDLEEDGKKYFIWSGETDKQVAEIAKRLFNSKDNIRGQKISVIIGSETVSEGVSFRNVKTAHILSPRWNESRIRQTIARCVRFGSHCDIINENPNVVPTVTVFKHVSVFDRSFTPVMRTPDKLKTHILSFMSIDQYMYLTSSKKNLLIRPYDEIVKRAAIDCDHMKKGNLYRLEERIVPSYSDERKNMIYYQNPTNSKKYMHELSHLNLIDKNIVFYDNFIRLEKGTVLQEYKISKNNKVLEKSKNSRNDLVIGEDISDTLIGYEKIQC
ncbi:putative ATP-dependent RNA helicase [Heterosigma akashiwo virus 01]|uniref:Putative ATP-dependent RNA helicase n=1 Tax=Heterosigma akashiwo virus 01 TaxID=97195 RepID=A0A1C9C5A3_HAV01|nr:putative ATP-dependent RNA helicase [Heterosigma akashiwo virus 01]AOM63463.1 putative ATP-dependent RNA helicase [Heterosigma akashiwo virus 01]